MVEKMRAYLYAGEEQGGMEMIQVAFSIAIAVALGTVLVAFTNNTIIPGIQNVNNNSSDLFKNLTNATNSFKTN